VIWLGLGIRLGLGSDGPKGLMQYLGTYRYSDTRYSDTHYYDTFASFARGQYM